MATGFSNSRHWRWAGTFFIVDLLLVWASFLIGIWIRFGTISFSKLAEYAPAVTTAGIVLPIILYIGGLYSHRKIEGGWIAHARWLLFGFLGVAIAILVIGSLDFSSRIGRGVLFAAFPFLVGGVLVRHLIIQRRKRCLWRTVLSLVTNRDDEIAAKMLYSVWEKDAKALGLVTGEGYEPVSDLPVVGSLEGALSGRSEIEVDVLLVRDRHFAEPDIGSALRRFRYEGTEIVSLANVCEESYQAVPLLLITDSWLFRASNQNALFYVRKLKRLFDVVTASFFLVLLSPALAVGALVVKFCSPGAILFRQVRAGKLGRPITVIKLRTMHLDSEKQGAKWSGEDDPRVFPAGRILRKFRIDEIPQLINILKGEMSFVGPRPEQAIMIDELDSKIPFYRERLMIQPGLTGWAQVRYPYGATIKDAERKLEYDLYYMKHMSVFLDFFILLETVKIILLGGVKRGGDKDYLSFRESVESITEPVPEDLVKREFF